MLPFFAIGAGLGLHTAWLERTMVRATGNPECFICHTNYARDLLQAGRLDDAIREYQRALGTPSPEDYLAHNGLGVALVRAGRLAEGIELMRECVRLRPDYEHGRANLETALALTKGP